MAGKHKLSNLNHPLSKAAFTVTHVVVILFKCCCILCLLLLNGFHFIGDCINHTGISFSYQNKWYKYNVLVGFNVVLNLFRCGRLVWHQDCSTHENVYLLRSHLCQDNKVSLLRPLEIWSNALLRSLDIRINALVRPLMLGTIHYYHFIVLGFCYTHWRNIMARIMCTQTC